MQVEQLHESVKDTYKEIIIKEHEGFRLILKKHKVISPSNLFALDLVQQHLKDGEIVDACTYNFFMTKEEMATLASALTA